MTEADIRIYRFRLLADQYRTIRPADEAAFFRRFPKPFAGRTMMVSPTPVQCVFADEDKPVADFMAFMPGTFVVPESTLRKNPLRLSPAELIPLVVDEQTFFAVNVTHILNALDRQHSDPATPPLINAQVRTYRFHMKRLSYPSIFKLPETAAAEVLAFSGLGGGIEDEFPLLHREYGFSGLTLDRLV